MFLRGIFHIFMAVQLFASSIGLVVNSHYCQDELKSHALFQKPPSCHELAAEHNHPPGCPMHQKSGETPCDKSPDGPSSGCCDDTSHILRAEQEQDFQPAELVVSFVSAKPLAAIIQASIDPLVLPIAGMPDWKRYRPPLIRGSGIFSLFQIFRF
ncbi:MAG: HYC_CC_PP family protein [Saprospiraceae bacterium]|jgi:hypothetical protein